jgi:hypothetical protein
MPKKAQPVQGIHRYVDTNTGQFTQSGMQALQQQTDAINSIPISVTGEQADGAGKNWTLAHAPAGNVSLIGETANGLVPLSLGAAKAWHYAIDGAAITTQQAFVGVIACYEYLQS